MTDLTVSEFGMRGRTGNDIELVTGRLLDLADPQPESISAVAIANGLANTGRWAGQTSRFYSVAEHTVHVARHLRDAGAAPAVVLWGLHHDDAEAFIGDLTSPLKGLLGEALHQVESRLLDAISVALDLPALTDDQAAAVKEADYDVLAIEARSFLPSKGVDLFCADRWDGSTLISGHPNPSHLVKALWLNWHRRLTIAAAEATDA